MNSHPIEILSCSAEDTRALGEKLGRILTSGLVLKLIGDLGSGKTVFVQGLAKGLEVSEKYYINSPTYTLINAYPGKIPLFHADLYRIEDPEEIESIGLYDIAGEDAVVAVEWADKMPDSLFSECLTLHVSIVDVHVRKISFSSFGKAAETLMNQFETDIKESP